MEGAAAALQDILQSPSNDATAASDAIKHLLNLQAVGLSSIQTIDPVKLYIEKQVSHVPAAYLAWRFSPCCLAAQKMHVRICNVEGLAPNWPAMLTIINLCMSISAYDLQSGAALCKLLKFP